MRKFLLFAIAISLGSIAFALNGVDCSVEENCHCNFFTQEQFYGIKGCSSCPVRENGHYVKCETIANGGVVNTDCCWLNTPQRPQNHPWSNCYTNAYVILDPSYGPPWARNCVKLLDALVGNGPESGAGAPNGGNGNNGSNGNNGGAAVKKTKVNKPTGHVITPSKPVKVNTTAQKSSASAAKVTPVQKAEKNKKAAK